MGLFKKKESVHFERDEEGRVIQMTRNGQDVDVEPEPKWKSTKQLEQEYYKKHPTRLQQYSQRRAEERKIGRDKFNAARLSEIKKQAAKRGRASAKPIRFSYSSPGRSNANPFGSLFDTGMHRPPSIPRKKKGKTQYKVIGGKAYPIAGTGKSKKKKATKSRKTGFGSFDPFDNWGFMK